MNSKSLLRAGLITVVILANISCDQVSKNLVRHKMYPYEMIHLFDNHILVTRVENSGAFLSVGDALPSSIKYVLLSFVPLLAVGLGLVYVFTKPRIPARILMGLSFVIGGGMGNLFDRITYGSVTDFLHVRFGVFQTGIFNLADVSIITGILIILLHFLVRENHYQSA